MKWLPGKSYVCVMSASPAYAVGDVVDCYKNAKDWKCVKGRDGLEDICSMLVSTFKPVDEVTEPRISVVG